MRTKNVILTLIIAATMTVPAAMASWSSAGDYEPSTKLDREGGFMFAAAPKNATGDDGKIYFNVVQSFSFGSVNPNVAATESRIYTAPLMSLEAFLGVWKDCNGDGYVGLAESAVREYRVDLGLHDETICPEQAWSYNDKPVHNDGQWVYEFLHIGNEDPCAFRPANERATDCGGVSGFTRNPVVLYSNDTYIWGDWGRPGPTTQGRTGCPINPPPYGTTSGTGYLAIYADCLVQANTQGVSALGLLNEALKTADPENDLRLQFDPDRPQNSDSPVNQHFPVNLYGNPQEGKPGQTGLIERKSGDEQFDLFDCDPGTSSSDPTRLRVKGYVRAPSDPVNQPTGSVWDAGEHLVEDLLYDCNSYDGPNALGDEYGAVRVEGTGGSSEGVAHKRENAHFFSFFDGARGTGASFYDQTLGLHRTPADLGVGILRKSVAGPRWGGHTNWLTDPQLIRQDLQPSNRAYSTFYARLNSADVGPNSWVLPAGTATGTYGAEACLQNGGPGIGPGKAAANGWECDPNKWFRRSDDVDTQRYSAECSYQFENETNYPPRSPTREADCKAMGGTAFGQRVGAVYHLRDVDCYDGHVFGGLVYASLVQATDIGVCDQETPAE